MAGFFQFAPSRRGGGKFPAWPVLLGVLLVLCIPGMALAGSNNFAIRLAQNDWDTLPREEQAHWGEIQEGWLLPVASIHPDWSDRELKRDGQFFDELGIQSARLLAGKQFRFTEGSAYSYVLVNPADGIAASTIFQARPVKMTGMPDDVGKPGKKPLPWKSILTGLAALAACVVAWTGVLLAPKVLRELFGGERPPSDGAGDWRRRYALCSGQAAQGGFGHVYTVRPRWGFRKLKLKTLRSKWQNGDQWLKQMRSECAVMRYLDRRGFRRFPRLVERGGALARTPQGAEAWFTMESAPGVPLSQIIGGLAAKGPEARISLACALVEAVGELHALGVAHRDLTPENIFVERGGLGGGWRVTLIDFGSSIVRDRDGRIVRDAETGDKLGVRFPPRYFVGKPRYCPPEQRADMDAADRPADVYALGIMIAQILLEGRLSGTTPVLLQPNPPSAPDPATAAAIRKELYSALVQNGGVPKSLARFLVGPPLQPDPALRCAASDFALFLRKDPAHVG